MGFVKGYLGRVVAAIKKDKDKDEDDVKHFQAQATDLVKMIIGKFGDFTFFTGEKAEANGSVCFRHVEGDSDDATFYYFLDSIKSVKM